MTPLYKRVNPIFFQFLLVAGGLWFFHCIAAFIIERYNIPIHISSETIPIYKRHIPVFGAIYIAIGASNSAASSPCFVHRIKGVD